MVLSQANAKENAEQVVTTKATDFVTTQTTTVGASTTAEIVVESIKRKVQNTITVKIALVKTQNARQNLRSLEHLALENAEQVVATKVTDIVTTQTTTVGASTTAEIAARVELTPGSTAKSASVKTRQTNK